MSEFDGSFEFNSEDFNPDVGLEAFPKGEYLVIASKLEQKLTKAGDGEIISYCFDVAEGEFKGRKVFGNFNVKNPNPKAQQIGLGQMSALCRACGKIKISHLGELLNIAIKVKIGVEPDQNGEPRNKLISILWKDSSKPDLSLVSGGTGEVGKVTNPDDQVPF